MEEERLNEEAQTPQNTEPPAAPWQRALAWILIGVVLFAFFGVCYWMMHYGV